MCIVNSEKAKYEVEICDKNEKCICTVKFASVSVLCRFLSDFSFDLANCHVYRLKDLQCYDPFVILSIWNGINDEIRT